MSSREQEVRIHAIPDGMGGVMQINIGGTGDTSDGRKAQQNVINAVVKHGVSAAEQSGDYAALVDNAKAAGAALLSQGVELS